MKVYKSITIDIESGEVLEEESYEYDGPLMLCDGGGDGDGGGFGDWNEPGGGFRAVNIPGENPESPLGGTLAGLEESKGVEGGGLLDRFFQGFSYTMNLYSNPAIGVIGGMLYGALGEEGAFKGEAPKSFTNKNVGSEYPSKIIKSSFFNKENEAVITEPGPTPTLPENPNIDLEKRLGERRREIKKRKGYWSTRNYPFNLGPLDIFTPELY